MNDAMELAVTIVLYPHWMEDKEKRDMLVNMARRIVLVDMKRQIAKNVLPPLDTAPE